MHYGAGPLVSAEIGQLRTFASPIEYGTVYSKWLVAKMRRVAFSRPETVR